MKRLLVALSAIAMVGGCLSEPDPVDLGSVDEANYPVGPASTISVVSGDEAAPEVPLEPDYYQEIGVLEVLEVELGGTIGEIGNLEGGQLFRYSGYGDEMFITMEGVVQTPTGAAMAIILMETQYVVPGEFQRFEIGTDEDVFTMPVTVIGCSGPEDGVWDYDKPATEVDMRVNATDDPEIFAIEFNAIFGAPIEWSDADSLELFGNEQTEAHGTFTVRMPFPRE